MHYSVFGIKLPFHALIMLAFVSIALFPACTEEKLEPTPDVSRESLWEKVIQKSIEVQSKGHTFILFKDGQRYENPSVELLKTLDDGVKERNTSEFFGAIKITPCNLNYAYVTWTDAVTGLIGTESLPAGTYSFETTVAFVGEAPTGNPVPTLTATANGQRTKPWLPSPTFTYQGSFTTSANYYNAYCGNYNFIREGTLPMNQSVSILNITPPYSNFPNICY